MNNIRIKIATIIKPKQLTYKNELINVSDIKGNEIIGKTIVTAISPGTEVAAYLGAPPLRPVVKVYPRVVGYCNVAEIVAVGKDVKQLKIGNRILTHQSHRSAFIIDEKEVLLKLPNDVDVIDASTTYLFNWGYDALLKADAKPGYNIGVIGLGTLGLATIAIASLHFNKVFGFSNQAYNSRIASEMGATKVFKKDRSDASNIINNETNGVGLDVIIVTSNEWKDWELALKLSRKGGKIVVMGFPGRNESIPYFNPLEPSLFFDKQLAIIASGYVPNYDVLPCDIRFTVKRNTAYLFDLIYKKRLPARKLVSKIESWDKLKSIYTQYEKRENGLLSCVLDWGNLH